MEILGGTSCTLSLEGSHGSEAPLLASAAEAPNVSRLCPASHLLLLSILSHMKLKRNVRSRWWKALFGKAGWLLSLQPLKILKQEKE